MTLSDSTGSGNLISYFPMTLLKWTFSLLAPIIISISEILSIILVLYIKTTLVIA